MDSQNAGQITMLSDHEQAILQHLSRYVTEHKKEFIDKVLELRTRHITLVLEDIFQSQNSSAAIRTCECLGIQDVHIIENKSKYTVNRKVLKGADKWITMHRYRDKDFSDNQTGICFRRLRDMGYRIVAADPSEDGTPVDNIDVASPLAIVLGNELTGLSDYALTHADEKVRIPMYGFTESFNISVSAALCLQTAIKKLHAASYDTKLSRDEKNRLKLMWFRKIVRRSEIIEREFLRTIA